MSKQLFYPVDIKYLQEWPGPRDGGSWWHYGTDFALPIGTPLRASFDGQVVFARGDGASGRIPGTDIWANGEGLTVDLRRDDGLIARYGHLSGFAVKEGDWVRAGQIICYSGNTGFTTGPHTHWELRWDRLWTGGAWADPRDLGAKNWEENVAISAADIEKIAKRTAHLVLTTQVKTSIGKRRSLSGFLKMEDNRWNWEKARMNEFRTTLQKLDKQNLALTKSVATANANIAKLTPPPQVPVVPDKK